MIRRVVAPLFLMIALSFPAAAQERVTVGTMRATANGALFLAAAQGYFKAEGLDVDMTAYASDKDVVDALAAGATDFGLAGFTPAAFNHAGRKLIAAVAAQVREKRDYEGNELIVSNAAYARGIRKAEDLAGKTVAISHFGSAYHYQLGQIARLKNFDLSRVTVKPMQTLDAMARAVGIGEADATILPVQYAREMLVASQAKFVAWYSELDEQQLGALFASAKTIAARRETVEKFLRAYRRGAADYALMLRTDRYGKRVSNAKSREIASIIARYAYPGKTAGAASVEAGAYFMEAHARLDLADIERQVAWYKTQGLIEASVEAGNVVDSSFTR